MVNTILARRVNHIVAKGDSPAWPKGSKSRGFSNYQVPLQSNNITNTGITIYGTHAQITTDGNSYNDNDRGYVPSLIERRGKVQKHP